MALSNDLLSQFAKVIKPEEKKSSGSTVYGTVVEYNGEKYVKLDGSDLLTPVNTTSTIEPDDRVTVTIKDHTATVTGNVTTPSASTGQVEEIGSQISEFEIIIADKVDTIEFNAEKARIDQLYADNVVINEKLTANEADIKDLEADNVTINDKLTANEADIDDLKAVNVEITGKLEAVDADIGDLQADNVTIHNSLNAAIADIGELQADNVTITGELDAAKADIEELNATKLSAEQADLKYANIDFANIGSAAIENFFSKSGMIGDLVVGEGTITGTLVGVTIKGDLIEGGTVVADKLVIKGSDGLFYKLNTDGVTTSAEQTEYNSLSGTVITAKSITAEKVAVDDLVAFDATIGGFNITEDSLYSGVKESALNTTRGVFMNDDGEFSVGDSNNYLRYFKDAEGNYKLEISASGVSIKVGGQTTTVEDALNNTVSGTTEQFYQSDSPTELVGGAWSNTQPTWTEGKYIWRRTIITYSSGRTEYTPDENGVCITGNPGTGTAGEDGEDAILLMIFSSNGTSFKNSSVATTLTVSIFVGGEEITSSDQMYAKFGDSAALRWEKKEFGQSEFTEIPSTDSRLSDNGFILTLNANDIYKQTVFNCYLDF